MDCKCSVAMTKIGTITTHTGQTFIWLPRAMQVVDLDNTSICNAGGLFTALFNLYTEGFICREFMSSVVAGKTVWHRGDVVRLQWVQSTWNDGYVFIAEYTSGHKYGQRCYLADTDDVLNQLERDYKDEF